MEYRTEKQRLETFVNWPHRAPPHPLDLVKAGFYYTGQGDQVRCVYCNGELKDWAVSDIPREEHRRHFPHCSFVTQGFGAASEVAKSASESSLNRGLNRVSVTETTPINQNTNEHHQRLINQSQIQVLPNSQQSNNCVSTVYRQSENLEHNYLNQTRTNQTHSATQINSNFQPIPQSLDYSKEQNRLKSFVNWVGKVDFRQLARAGLYYLGQFDRVKCFSCQTVFRDWEYGDDPWIEHAKWQPECQYLQLCLGRDVAKQIRQEVIRDLPRDIVDCVH